MKVLQHPPTPENWSVKAYCSGWGHTDDGCGAKLKVFREDLRYAPPTEDKEVGAVTFKCICCGKLTDLGMGHWPERYKTLKPYKRKWLTVETSDS